MVTLKTNFGDIKIELYSEEAPVSCKNFLEYVKSGFYKETLFHRVIEEPQGPQQVRGGTRIYPFPRIFRHRNSLSRHRS